VLSGILTAFGLGFVYFVGAIPAGVVAHAPVWVAALAAWLGYSAGGGVVLLAGEPLRNWITRKLKIDPKPDPSKLFWRIWGRFGLWGLGLIAPVTIGPQSTAAIALALGEHPREIQMSISLGVLPWVIIFGVLARIGAHGFHIRS
jgi:hypothetical protein